MGIRTVNTLLGITAEFPPPTKTCWVYMGSCGCRSGQCLHPAWLGASRACPCWDEEEEGNCVCPWYVQGKSSTFPPAPSEAAGCVGGLPPLSLLRGHLCLWLRARYNMDLDETGSLSGSISESAAAPAHCFSGQAGCVVPGDGPQPAQGAHTPQSAGNEQNWDGGNEVMDDNPICCPF